MEIIFYGRHDSQEAVASLESIINLLKERYAIGQFREMHLSVTLMDETGVDVELVDSETNEAYRIFEVYRQGQENLRRATRPELKLVVNNPRRNGD